MSKKKYSLLIIHGKGSKVRKINISSVFVIISVGVCLMGAASYFIPIKSLFLTEAEKEHKALLSQHNKILSKQLFSTLKMFDFLHSNIEKIQHKYKELSEFDGHQKNLEKSQVRPVKNPPIKVDSLLEDVKKYEFFITAIANKTGNDPSVFRFIPVIKPLIIDAPISYGFGKRLDPFTGETKFHYGIDFVAPTGTSVIATASGTVISVSEGPLWGKKIVLQHGFGFSSVYAHLSSVKVRSGANVSKGEIIGTVGMTGQSIGPHLHYEVQYNGSAIDPLELLFPDIDSLLVMALEKPGELEG